MFVAKMIVILTIVEFVTKSEYFLVTISHSHRHYCEFSDDGNYKVNGNVNHTKFLSYCSKHWLIHQS